MYMRMHIISLFMHVRTSWHTHLQNAYLHIHTNYKASLIIILHWDNPVIAFLHMNTNAFNKRFNLLWYKIAVARNFTGLKCACLVNYLHAP